MNRLDMHSSLHYLITHESGRGPYCIKKIEVPFPARDLYQISVHRIRSNEDGKQYLEHMMYTEIISGRDCVNSRIEELTNSKQDIQVVCDTQRIDIRRC